MKNRLIRCAVLLGLAAGPVRAQNFGIHFLGGTTDNVTGTAGVVAISNWNNVANGTYTLGTPTTITADNGVTTATLVLLGNPAHNAWQSGIAGDGADLSLMNGYMDTGNNATATIVISNLTGAAYDVYVYALADQTRPSNGGDLLPNYSVNGTTYYFPVLGATGASSYDTANTAVGGTGFNGYVRGTVALANSSSPVNVANFGNYIKISTVTPVNGAITIKSEADGTTWRSPLNGIELTPAVATPPSANAPTESPASASIAYVAGGTVSLTASASGTAPISYLWQTDGGTGGALTNIPGATSSNLLVNTAGWALGTYQYAFVASNSLGTNLSPEATITIVSTLMADIGTNPPAAGSNDISQLLSSTQTDDGINYYTDNGPNNNQWSGQTFTTGSALTGYVLNTIAWKSAGNGNSFGTFQRYDLYIYALSGGGATATLLTNYQAFGGGTENDWFQWQGLNVPLAPNAQYAYAFGRDQTSGGWEHIANQGGNPYSGGKLCAIPSQGGTVRYGNTGVSDSTFQIGLSISQAPFASVPVYTPNANPVFAGTTVTLSEIAIGAPPLSYQWLADNGTGTLSIDNGATGSNLVVNTSSLAPGTYQYAVTVTNSHGSSTSGALTLNVVAASGPLIVNDISPAPVNQGYVGQTVSFSASFNGTLPITYQWMLDTGSGPHPVSGNPTATSNTLVLTNLQLAQAGVYTVVASNSVSTLSSGPSTLTVFTDLAAPAPGTYGALVLSNHPVAYYRFSETNDPSTGVLPAYDSSGNGFYGTYETNSQDGFNGIVGPQPTAFPGLESTNTALYSQVGLGGTGVTVPPLNLTSSNVTIAMWINPAGNEPTFSGLFFNRDYGAGIGFGGALNSDGMPELGYTWNNNAQATWSFNSRLFPPANQWSFVALVVQPTQATLYLYYIDSGTGQAVLNSAVNPIPHVAAPFNNGTTTVIGNDPQDPTNRAFGGVIDEVAVFNTALSSDKLLGLFGEATGLSQSAPNASTPLVSPSSATIATVAGSTITLTGSATGSTPMTFRWQTDGGTGGALTNIPGATNTTLQINTTGWAVGTYYYDYSASNSLGTNLSPEVSITIVPVLMVDIGTAAPAVGPGDIAQLLNSSQNDDGFNYYTDNGANNNKWNGQTFTTGNSSGGYVLKTLSWKSAGNGNSFGTFQLYDLYLYSLSADLSTATLVTNYQAYGGGLENDWFQWVGLNVPLTANTHYAYALGRDSTAGGWEHMGNQTGNPYAGGEICQIPSAGGAVGYGNTDNSDAAFVIGFQSGPSVTVNLTHATGGNLTLQWSQGTLLQSTNAAGPWVPNNTAVSPYTVSPTNSQMYFRVRVQ